MQNTVNQREGEMQNSKYSDNDQKSRSPPPPDAESSIGTWKPTWDCVIQKQISALFEPNNVL